MKSSEIAAIILIVALSSVTAFFAVRALWGDPSVKTHTVQYMDEISQEFVKPSSDIFNKDAINPTTTIEIGSDNSSINTGDNIEAVNANEVRANNSTEGGEQSSN